MIIYDVGYKCVNQFDEILPIRKHIDHFDYLFSICLVCSL